MTFMLINTCPLIQEPANRKSWICRHSPGAGVSSGCQGDLFLLQNLQSPSSYHLLSVYYVLKLCQRLYLLALIPTSPRPGTGIASSFSLPRLADLRLRDTKLLFQERTAKEAESQHWSF